jgi:hypothetical protein
MVDNEVMEVVSPGIGMKARAWWARLSLASGVEVECCAGVQVPELPEWWADFQVDFRSIFQDPSL